MIKKLWLFALLASVTFLAYGSSLFFGFSQDDWFHLSISRADSLVEFLNFFNPGHVSWIFFRPLSTQLPYFLATSLFGLAGAPYFLHLVMLVLHTVNAVLVTQIAKKFIAPSPAVILGVVYALASSHFLSLFYIGAVQQIISTLFSLLAIKHLLTKKNPSWVVLTLLTLASLLSKELALRLPVILFFLSWYKSRDFKFSLRTVASPVLIALLYLGLRAFSGAELASEYHLVFGLGTTIASLMWYLLFLLGFPEYLLRFGLSQGRIDFLGFFAEVGLPGYLIGVTAVILLVIIAKSIKRPLIFPFLALVSLAPIIFLPTHRYPHYLDFAILFVGIWILTGIKKLTLLHYLALALVVVSMLASVAVEKRTHWTIKRALHAKNLVEEIKNNDLCYREGGVVYNGSKQELQEISYALSLANGPRVICENPDLAVYYYEEQL